MSAAGRYDTADLYEAIIYGYIQRPDSMLCAD